MYRLNRLIEPNGTLCVQGISRISRYGYIKAELVTASVHVLDNVPSIQGLTKLGFVWDTVPVPGTGTDIWISPESPDRTVGHLVRHARAHPTGGAEPSTP